MIPTDLIGWLDLIARVLIGAMNLDAAIRNIPHLQRLSAHVASRGFPFAYPGTAAATALQAVCSLLVIVGVFTPWAVIGLILFTIPATWLFHNFWDMEGEERTAKRISFRINIVVLGGLFALLALSL